MKDKEYRKDVLIMAITPLVLFVGVGIFIMLFFIKNYDGILTGILLFLYSSFLGLKLFFKGESLAFNLKVKRENDKL